MGATGDARSGDATNPIGTSTPGLSHRLRRSSGSVADGERRITDGPPAPRADATRTSRGMHTTYQPSEPWRPPARASIRRSMVVLVVVAPDAPSMGTTVIGFDARDTVI